MTTETKQKLKKIGGIVGNVLIWVFVAFSVLVTILVFAAQSSEDGVPELFGKSLITIETPSMEPVFKVGDMVLLEKLEDSAKPNIKTDDIITFHAPIDINGDGKIGDINTHRVVSNVNGVIQTRAEDGTVDNYTIGYNDVIGVCQPGDRIAGLGGVVSFLRSSLGFLLCIVLPLVLFFVYELYNFITLIVQERAKKAPVSAETEEEIKRRAIEEYLAQQQSATQPVQQQEQTEQPKTDDE